MHDDVMSAVVERGDGLHFALSVHLKILLAYYYDDIVSVLP